MDFIYCTADRIGTPTGGGSVTHNELLAMQMLGGSVSVFDQAVLGQSDNPFDMDSNLYIRLMENDQYKQVKLAHFYSGTFSKTIQLLKRGHTRITYTAAAHSIEESRKAHTELSLTYNYPHLTDPDLWEQYVTGYKSADVLICPSTHSAKVMADFGCTAPIRIIPHGTSPVKVKPMPKTFRLGYLGAIGADKGLIYLLQAWKMADLKDASLVLAGPHITSLFHVARIAGGRNIEFKGYVDSPSDLYNYCTVYCQPSVTEGFGIEVIEALAHGRPVIVSSGAGAADVVTPENGLVVRPKHVGDLVEAIIAFAKMPDLEARSVKVVHTAAHYYWPVIYPQYVMLWKKELSNAASI